MTDDNTKLVSVFNGSPMEVEMVCQILNDNGIEASMSNQLIGTIAPHHAIAGADVFVKESDKDKALEWVKEFNNSAKA
ncbi:putative signal transducing protein [Carboxylicivirga sp. M1479]|uniref:putative signal transducing protein n=1 Tax=Carboxylicivirga sp. M1479 TaxID=2594476 RepID=UPI001178C74A|nr:DUF2007 domain-containing protein [Carboxylicivirga sp. M1479]TRX66127.1 DUF2007 domain-containing protein [Carboxylicivirga sp. M1479]